MPTPTPTTAFSPKRFRRADLDLLSLFTNPATPQNLHGGQAAYNVGVVNVPVPRAAMLLWWVVTQCRDNAAHSTCYKLPAVPVTQT